MSETTQGVLDFLQSRRSDVVLTTEQFNSLAAELRGKINQIPVDAPGSVTVLYSGWVDDNGKTLHSGAVASALADAQPGQVRTINQTEVSNLLNSKEFRGKLQAALGPESPETAALYKTLIDGSVVNNVTN